MNDSMDRRVRKSKAAIFGAFEELLRQKSYASITVGDITETADVGRTTFYAHFQTKDALLDELCKDIFAHVIAPAPEKGHSFSSDSTEEQLLRVLCHLAEQRDRLAPLLASPSSHLFWGAIESQFVAFFEESIGTSVRIKPGVQDELYAEHLGKTLCEVVRWWFAGKLAEEPKAALAGFLSLTDVSFVTAQGGSHMEYDSPAIVDSAVPAALKRSLLDLLSEKRLSRISVRELAAEANIGRTTFYDYYPNILAVYQELVDDSFSGVRTVIEQFGCGRCTASEKMPFCERLRVRDEYAVVIEDPQFSRVWMKRLGTDPTSAPMRRVLTDAGIPRPQAEAVMLFQASGCLMVARSPFGKRDDWSLTRRTLDEFVSGGFDHLTKGSFPQ